MGLKTGSVLVTVGSLAAGLALVWFASRKPRATRAPRRKGGGVGYSDVYRLDDAGNASRLHAPDRVLVKSGIKKVRVKGKVKKKYPRPEIEYGSKIVDGQKWTKRGSPLFTSTSKLRAPSWGVAAGGSCSAVRTPIDRALAKNPNATNEELAETLQTEVPRKCWGCYATGGNYAYEETRKTQERRASFFFGEPREKVIETLVDGIKHAGRETCKVKEGSKKHVCSFDVNATPKFFRVFDSGDFTGPYDVEVWTEIARRLPEVKFWFPTTGWATCGWDEVTQRRFDAAMAKANELGNVVARPSAIGINVAAPDLPGYGPGSTVYDPPRKEHRRLHSGVEYGTIRKASEWVTLEGRKHWVCPGDCTYCRKCWSKDVPVAYLRHGKLPKVSNFVTLIAQARRAGGSIDAAVKRRIAASIVTNSDIGPEEKNPRRKVRSAPLSVEPVSVEQEGQG